MLASLLYIALRRLLELVVLACRSEEFRELEIVVVGHEVAILRRQVARPALRSADRTVLAAASRLLMRFSRTRLTDIVHRLGYAVVGRILPLRR